MISALTMYGDGLRDRAGVGGRRQARLIDGTVLQLPIDRYLRPADATDERVLNGLRGPVLDVGCGPGRHLRALAARGVFALGVDLSPVAVSLAVDGGARAIVADIFAEIPGGGSWRSALLLDGNVGIGGSPVRLLSRIGALLGISGELLVELEPPGAVTCLTRARLESEDRVSAWFPWARVAAPAIGVIAQAGGFRAVETWNLSGRWFGRLRRDDARFVSGRRHGDRRNAGAASVP